MIKSNLLTAIRHLMKNKGLSAINIFGLSVSVAICLLSYLFISYEYSHDDFHKKGDRIYQVINKVKFDGDDPYYNSLQNHKLAADLKRDIPQIEAAAAFRTCGGWVIYENKKFSEKIAFTDSSFFKIFTFDFLINSERDVLKNEKDIFITQEFADKLINAKTLSDYSKLIGQSLCFHNIDDRPLTIAGILKNIPRNSSLKFDIVAQYQHAKHYSQSNTEVGNSNVYLSLNKASDKEIVERNVTSQIKKFYKKAYENYTSDAEDDSQLNSFTLELLPFKDKYFSDKLNWAAYSDKGDKKRSSILTYISILVLILACVNYVMLSVGLSMKRFKEIGVKKVFGGKRISIILQLVTETSLTVAIAIIIGVVIAELSVPLFNDLSGFNLEFNMYSNFWAYFFLIILFTILVGIISIPSIYISKQTPDSILRNQTKIGSRLGMAKSFIVVQFTLSLLLIIVSVFIVEQINYMKSHDVGFSADNIITVSLPYKLKDSKSISLQNRFRDILGVESMGSGDRNFVSGSSSSRFKIDTVEIQARLLRIDTSYINTLGLKLLDGRNLRETDNIDTLNTVIINESFARRLNWKQPIGKIFTFWRRNVEVVGLLKDFNFDSMRSSVAPLICVNDKNRMSFLFIKVKEGEIYNTVNQMKSIWKEYSIEQEFAYGFLDEDLKKQYESEERIAKIIFTITFIALLISVFGLIGLTMLLLMQKVKEIGIRKINGASTTQILFIINKEFAKYLLIAAFIAIPVSYYGLSKWLESFAYKTPLSWWIFIICFLLLGVVIILTISYKSFRAAMTNPVDAIKYE